MEVAITQGMIDFAGNYANGFINHDKSAKQFGNNDSIRHTGKRIEDAIKGKLGELVFAYYAKHHYGVTVVLDNTLRVGDSGDLGCNDIESVLIYGESRFLIPSVDIKSSQPNSRWLLVERHMFKASIYIMTLIDKNMGVLAGWCHRSDFYNEEGKLKYNFNKGDKIPNTGMSLLAENVALPIDELRNNWEQLFMIIRGNSLRKEAYHER